MLTLWLFGPQLGNIHTGDVGLDEPDSVLWVTRAFAAARWDGAEVDAGAAVRKQPLLIPLSEGAHERFVDLLERLDADALRAARRLGSNWGDVYDLLDEAAPP
jgi:hypothetical protein